MNGYGFRGWLSPLQMLGQVEREMKRLLGEVTGRPGVTFPPINMYTEGDGAVITAELPGLDPKDLDLTVTGQTLVLRGERKPHKDDKNIAWQRQERIFGRFAKSIELPFTADPEKVDAMYRDGVLTVRLNRSPADKPRKIAIQ